MSCDEIRRSILDLLSAQVACDEDNDGWLLQTPLVLQDGHALKVRIERTGSGYRVSDDQFAASQIQIFGQSETERSLWSDHAGEIARTLGLRWDGEQFLVEENDLDAAIKRIGSLAQAVDRVESLHSSRPANRIGARSEPELVEKRAAPAAFVVRVEDVLREELIQRLRSQDLSVEEGPQFLAGGRSVALDLAVRRNGSRAGVVCLTARTRKTALAAVEHAVSLFHIARRAEFTGLLAGVYDDRSSIRRPDIQGTFELAAPSNSRLFAMSDAARGINDELERHLLS